MQRPGCHGELRQALQTLQARPTLQAQARVRHGTRLSDCGRAVVSGDESELSTGSTMPVRWQNHSPPVMPQEHASELQREGLA